MRLSDNERIMLEAIRDNDFRTIAQVTQHCGFTRAMGYHYFRSLSLGGLIDGFEVTYAGHMILNDQKPDAGDFNAGYSIRPGIVEAHLDTDAGK